jgi:thiamine-monophosphate kinase
MKNSKITEAGIIKLAEKFFPANAANIVKGIGDDTAVLRTGPGYQLFTSDILIEGTHFLFDKISPYDLGWKALAVNISDIAAMGGGPTSALLSIGLNDIIDNQWLESFYHGLADCGLKYQVSVVGGDTVYSKHSLVINIALLGQAVKPVYRDKAQPGYLLLSTGRLGESGAGFWVMQNCREPLSAAEKYCLNRHTLPVPRVEAANFISSRAENLAMIDCSDGLYISGKTLCEQSEVGLELAGERLPVSDNLKEVSEKAGRDPLEFILYGGEDYELIIAMPEMEYNGIKDEYMKLFHSPLYCIGKFNERKNEIILKYNNSDKILNDRSFKHFS